MPDTTAGQGRTAEIASRRAPRVDGLDDRPPLGRGPKRHGQDAGAVTIKMSGHPSFAHRSSSTVTSTLTCEAQADGVGLANEGNGRRRRRLGRAARGCTGEVGQHERSSAMNVEMAVNVGREPDHVVIAHLVARGGRLRQP
jgi:hypothetical protein